MIENRKEILDAIEALGVVKADAKLKGYKKGKGGIGIVECPICKGTLRYSVASTNGHTWGGCDTEGCVRWME